MADASPVDPGHLEIESTASWSQARRTWDQDGSMNSRGLAREQAVGLALTVGISENVDGSMSLDYLQVRDEDNGFPTTGDDVADLSLGTRWRFFAGETAGLEAAWITGVTVPTGSDGTDNELGTSGQEFWSWDNSLVVSKDWGRWIVNAEVGWSLPFGDRRDDTRGTLIANFATGYQIRDWLQPEAELNYSRDYERDADEAEMLAVTAGVVMPLNNGLRIGLGAQQAVWGRNTDNTTTAMVRIKTGF